MCGEDGSMSQRMKLFIFLLIINLIVIVIYLVWNHIRRKENLRSVWMKAVMMFLCPVSRAYVCFACFLLSCLNLFSSQRNGSFGCCVQQGSEQRNFCVRTRMWNEIWFRWKRRWKLRTEKVSVPLMLNVIRGDYRNSLASINTGIEQ